MEINEAERSITSRLERSGSRRAERRENIISECEKYSGLEQASRNEEIRVERSYQILKEKN